MAEYLLAQCIRTETSRILRPFGRQDVLAEICMDVKKYGLD